MALTTTNLRDRAKERFRDPSNYVVSDAQWLAYLNEAYQEVNARARWPWVRAALTVPTVVGQTNYTLDAALNSGSVDSVYNATNEMRLNQEEGTSEYRVDFPLSYTGAPEGYRMFSAGVIQIFPIPDAVYSLRIDVNGVAADLNTSSSDPLWPDHYRRALIDLAMSRAYLDDGNMEWSTAHRDLGEAIVADMHEDLFGRPRNESYPLVNDNWYA